MSCKKILIAITTALLLAGCCHKNSYNIAFLGDIHYDRTDLHDFKVYEKFNPEVPFVKGVINKDGLFSWRSQTLWASKYLGHDPKAVPQNVRMWQKDTPLLLDKCAADVKKNNALYLFQLGDMVQGDAGNYTLHHRMLSGGLDSMTSRVDVPVLAAMGNHDTRGPGGMKAWQEIIESYYDSHIDNIRRKNSNFYYNIKGDTFFFYDLLNPDLDLLEEAINTDCRYFFFISHVPVLPAHSGTMKNIITDDTERLINLLLKRNAIVLSGHTHMIMHCNYNTDSGIITQFIINSTLRVPEKQKNFTPEIELPKKKAKISEAQKKLWEKLFDGKLDLKLLTNGSGYGILRVSDQGVYVDFHNVDCKPVTFTLRSQKNK